MKQAPGQFAQVTAAEISRNFGQWQDRAIAGPVVVTHHGRPRVVIVSADQYASLCQNSGADAEHDPRTSLSAVLDHVSDGFVSLNEDLRIASVNKVAAAYFNLGAERMAGQPLAAILPERTRSVVVEHCRRVLRCGESVSFEIGEPEGSDRHIHVHAFPYPGGLGLSFSNRTELHALQEYMADLRSIRAALSAHAAISFVTLNVRGTMSGCSDSFAAFTGRRREDLEGAVFTELLSAADRERIREALDRVLDGQELVKLEAAMLTGDGGERPVCITMAPIIRQAATEGVSVVLHGDRLNGWGIPLREDV